MLAKKFMDFLIFYSFPKLKSTENYRNLQLWLGFWWQINFSKKPAPLHRYKSHNPSKENSLNNGTIENTIPKSVYVCLAQEQ